MSTKTLTVYFYSIDKLVGAEQTKISKKELKSAIDSVQALALDKNANPTRFYDNGKDERCIIFQSDRDDIPKTKSKDYLPGLFIKRRSSNYPYENDDKGNLLEIKLSNNKNELAEVTYFIIDMSLRVLLLVNNKYVGSSTAFEDYLKNRIDESVKTTHHQVFDKDMETRIVLSFIINEDPEHEFMSMTDISSLELRIAGSLKLLESYLDNDKNSSAQAMKNLVQFAEHSRSKTISLLFTTGHQKREKLDKKEITNLYKRLKIFFTESADTNNKFILKGVIDEETRYIDLLNDRYFHKCSFDYTGRYLPLNEVFRELYILMDKYHDIFIRNNSFKEDKL
jgi:hypothetical protein